MFKNLLSRWSLYIVKNNNELVYAMHENSVLRLLDYVVDFFKNGKEPIDPWSLYLNFNKSSASFKLGNSHFTTDGNYLTTELISKIEELDPDFKEPSGAKPVFMDMRIRKKLEIKNDQGDSVEPTFYNIMHELFVR